MPDNDKQLKFDKVHFKSRTVISDNDAAPNEPPHKINSDGKKAHKAVIVICTCIILFLAAFFLYWAYKHAYILNEHFFFRKIQVNATPHFTEKQILEMLDNFPEGSACHLGKTNILNLNLAKVRASIIDNPNIQDAEIRRIMPDTLAIELKERTPVAFVCCDAKQVYALIDEFGVLFPFIDSLNVPAGTPFITYAKLDQSLKLGNKTEDKMLLSAINLINYLNIKPQMDYSGMSPIIIKLNYDRNRLETLMKPSIDNIVIPKTGAQIWIPVEEKKQLDALDKLDKILSIKQMSSETLQFADITLEVNIPTR